MSSFLNKDRRQFSVIDITASTIFILVILFLTLWIFKIDSSLSTVKTMQTIVLTSNQKSTKACNLAIEEMEKVHSELRKIYWLVFKFVPKEEDGRDSGS